MQSVSKLFDAAIAHYEKKEYEEAEKNIDELLAIHPDFPRGRFLKAVILEETGRAGEAEAHYAKAGNRFTLWARLAGQLEDADPERAVRYYERATEKDPSNNMLWFNMGSLYEKMGRSDEAGKCFRKLQLVREVLSRVFIPLGFLIILVAGGRLMVLRGDLALAVVVFLSALFCLVWLRRDGGKGMEMIRKKKQYR